MPPAANSQTALRAFLAGEALAAIKTAVCADVSCAAAGEAAAALASGMTTLATGSDMGGSIRIPCSLTGLYGFKPPFGRVATDDDGAFEVPDDMRTPALLRPFLTR